MTGLAISLASYYLLRAVGASVVVALVLPSVVTVVLVLLRWARTRKIDRLALIMLGIVVVGIAISAWSGSPRFLMAKSAFVTVGCGVVFLLSLRWRRPLAFTFARALVEGFRWPTLDWDDVWQAERRFRRAWQASTAIWA